MLVFDRLVLDVTNLEQSLHFYTEVLDFQVASNTYWQTYRTAIVQLGAFHILLLEQEPDSASQYQLPKAGPVLGLSDSKIEARAESFQRAGIEIIAPLTESSWGERSMMILDPDGYLIMIQEPREESVGDGDHAPGASAW